MSKNDTFFPNQKKKKEYPPAGRCTKNWLDEKQIRKETRIFGKECNVKKVYHTEKLKTSLRHISEKYIIVGLESECNGFQMF